MTSPDALARTTRILIVDDSTGIRSVLESYLRRLGFTEIRTAATVEEGLKAFREQESELVFLDMVIGDERGADFAAAALAERPFTVVVVMTAVPMGNELVVSAVAEGAREFLPKPVQMLPLQALLGRIARSRHLDGEGPAPDASYG
jgi:DNA-binding NtrC family response regulator